MNSRARILNVHNINELDITEEQSILKKMKRMMY